eukprot:gene18244-24697_t
MIVPIVGPDGALVEWTLVELQGKLEGLDGAAVQSIGNLQLSKINQDVIQLTIGYHQLVGKRVGLKKPFAILDTKESPVGSQRDSVQKEYQVVGVIRSKILFKTRPTALISKPAAGFRT